MSAKKVTQVGGQGKAGEWPNWSMSDLKPPLQMNSDNTMMMLSGTNGTVFIALGIDNKVHVYQRDAAAGDFILRGSVELAT